MMLEEIDLNTIQDESARQLVVQLLNLLEDLGDAQAEIQRLRDENNRLKGEQGKPQIKSNTPKRARVDYSSEQDGAKANLATSASRRQHSRFIVNRS